MCAVNSSALAKFQEGLRCLIVMFVGLESLSNIIWLPACCLFT